MPDDREPPASPPAPDRAKLAPRLARWMEAGLRAKEEPNVGTARGGAEERSAAAEETAERRTVVVRPRRSADAAATARRLAAAAEAAGATVESTGPGAVTLIVTPVTLARVSRLDDVAAVDEPRRLEPKGPLSGGAGPL